jgi:RNA polymerase sigma factor (sigma-70 family)
MANVKESYMELALHFQSTGCIKTYTKLYNKMLPNLRNYVMNLVKDEDLCDDIVMVTMTKVYTKIHQYSPEFQITTWAYKIAWNDAIQQMRKRKRLTSIEVFRENGSDFVDGEEMMQNNEINVLADEYDPFTKSDMEIYESKIKEKYEKAISELHELKPIYKDILYKKYVENMSYKDIEAKVNEPYMFQYQNMMKEARLLYEKGSMDDYRKKMKDVKKFTDKYFINETTIKNRIHIGKKLLIDKLSFHGIVSTN